MFKDFELIELNEEQKDNSLIDKCLIVATRTKEVLTLQERTPTEEGPSSPTSKVRQLDNYLVDYFLSRSESNSRESYDFCGFPFYLSDQLIKYKQALDRESKMKHNPSQLEGEPQPTEAAAAQQTKQTKHQMITASQAY